MQQKTAIKANAVNFILKTITLKFRELNTLGFVEFYLLYVLKLVDYLRVLGVSQVFFVIISFLILIYFQEKKNKFKNNFQFNTKCRHN